MCLKKMFKNVFKNVFKMGSCLAFFLEFAMLLISLCPNCSTRRNIIIQKLTTKLEIETSQFRESF